jgi:mycofactocin precursor
LAGLGRVVLAAASLRFAAMEQDTTVAEFEVVDADVVEEELLVEEISIDGMCGVY